MARRFKTLVQLDSGLLIPAGAAVGKVLTSDASGNAIWTAAGGIEGTQIFTTPAADYTIPNGAWSTPAALDWHSVITVGPNQIWELVGTANVRCVTATHNITSRIGVRTSANVAIAIGTPGAILVVGTSTAFQPPVITTNFSMVCFGRITTDATVAPNTDLWIGQEFNGSGANGRVLRDGNYFASKASRMQ